MQRTEKTIKNIITGFGGQLILIIAQFICRSVFIKTLSIDYLGLNGLFSNILNILSLTEMGFGTAILFSLYKPLEEKDENKIIALLQLFKKIYYAISLIVLLLGSALIPFLNFFIKDLPDIPHLKLIYFLYLLNTVFSYTCVYKRSIIEADQKSYVINIYQKGMSIVQNILQLAFLLITRNYFVYLLIWLVTTLFTNIFLSKKANELYPFIVNKSNIPLDREELRSIKKNTYALFLHRIGGVVVNGTDNILISKFVGLALVGQYSNYTLITTNLNNLVAVIFNSATASIGNLGVSSSKEYLLTTFHRLYYLAFWVFGFCSISLFLLFNPFISIWVGNDFCLSNFTVLLIVINFYLSGMRILMRIFRDAFGLFWYFRYKSVVEALVNLLASLLLVNILGINGVLFGTILSTILVAYWIEPFVLYKHVFRNKPFDYFIRYAKYLIIILISGFILNFIINFTGQGLLSFLIKGVILLVGIPTLFIIFTSKTKEFKYFKNLIITKLRG